MTTLTYRTNHPPKLGEYLRSTRRPRASYFVVGIRDAGHVKGTLGGYRSYKLNVERRRADAPGDDDVVHPIYWDKR